jgi:hypothetical protein
VIVSNKDPKTTRTWELLFQGLQKEGKGVSLAVSSKPAQAGVPGGKWVIAVDQEGSSGLRNTGRP